MSSKVASRADLLERWRGIEEEEDDGDDFDPSIRRRLQKQKEQWFADAFSFLVSLPKENHIWCSSWDIMGPLLETFYNYFTDKRSDGPLRILWRRISEEMRFCIQCVCQHHQAQETYSTEYELCSIGPLLDVLQSLDEERVTQHLREINGRLAGKQYDPLHDNAQVVSVMYEVLMYPLLLDDLSLLCEFEKFIEAVDDMHELTLDGHQQFPGVYALFFLNRRVRTVGHRLARSMGKLRMASDMEPLQPLLKKFMSFLENEVLPSTLNTSRPRAQLERLPIWLGITSLLEFLEPPAFEEGILERYPIFLDIVLNHISGDLPEFSHVISCLKELFRMLGCKLWLRSTLSPSVMHNTLLGQCFHTRNEKIHKDIFDLFQPFLQSLEALQDGEHEKQRRHFLYFLLHQVPVSSNFSALTRKTACKIAFLIVQRGYQMNPPCPPFDCAHMWGPSLVSSLKDSSLHHSLQQPAFDLIQTIVAYDTAALIIAVTNCSTYDCKRNGIPLDLCNKVDENEVPSVKFLEEKDGSSWSELSAQSQIAYPEFEDWMCIPMIWICVLVDIDTSALPISLSKAVFWARSRFSMVELENGAEVAVDVRTWVSSSAPEISSTLGWKLPTGIDDGGQEQSKNSVRLSTACLPLIKTFKRIITHFVTEFSKTELRKQWTWEPRMSESLILSLIDPNDNIRQFGKCMLEYVSNTRGLSEGLKFLCSNSSSLYAVFLGLKHVLKLICRCYKNEVHLDPVLIKFQNLHHLFFVLRKLLKEVDLPNSDVQNSSDTSSCSAYSSHGGFLRQPCVDILHPDRIHNPLNIDSKLMDKFRYSVSEVVWPLLCKCLVEGRDFVDYSTCQMTCVRILEILPVLFEILSPTPVTHWSDLTEVTEKRFGVEWLQDLMGWGRSKLKVVLVYWRKAMTSLLNLFKVRWHSSLSMIQDIENLVSSDGVDMDALTEKVSCLCVQWSEEASGCAQNNSLKPRKLHSAAISIEQVDLASDKLRSSIEKTDKRISDLIEVDRTGNENNLIVLSDDEVEKDDLPGSLDGKKETTRSARLDYSPKRNASISDVAGERGAVTSITAVSEKQNFQKSRAKMSVSFHTSGVDGKMKELSTDKNVDENKNIGGNLMIDGSFNSQTINQARKKQVPEVSENVLKELVHDAVDDPLESAFKIARPQQPLVVKSGAFVPKRQVIQLKSPFESKSGNLNRLDAQIKRFKPPRLDAWYKPILEIDFFAIAGLAPVREDENSTAKKFQTIPVSFCSPEHYMNVFRPFVLEEFKAQLHSSFLEMSSLDDMYYGSLSVLSVERVDDFHLIRFVHDEDSASSKSFSENDLVLLTKERPGSTSHDVHMVGKVERRDRDNKRRSSMLLVRFYFQNGSQRLNLARRQLLERSKWHACRVMSITPQLREFQALSSLVSIPMHSILLNPNGSSSSNDKLREPDLSKLSQLLQRKLRSSYNDSQLQAISAAIGPITLKCDFDLSLIQGPPGTGKTKTILGIVSGLLASCHRKTNKYENSCPNDSKQSCSSSSTFRPKISQCTAIARAWQDAAFARQLNEDTEKNEKSIESYPRGRVLVCAQSNAAVDELVARICTGGLYGSDGKMYKPYIVRVGNAKTVHPNSLPFYIDTLVDHRLVEERNHVTNNMSAESSIAVRSKLEKVAEDIGFYEAKRAAVRDGSAESKKTSNDQNKDVKDMSDACIDAKLRSLYEHKKQIYKDLSVAQAQERKTNEEIKALRQKVRKSILREAEIVVTTLSGCGGDLYGVCAESISNCKFGIPSEQSLFDAVVIDEAAQALEPATLIPLQLLKTKGTKCIMVGDPKQLPATVLSNVASKYQFECSMFERVQRAGYPVVMLTKQYRMHPEICRFPSLHFYDNKLLNGENMSSKSATFHVNESLRPYVFYDVADGQEVRGRNSGSFSLYNECEAAAAVELLKLFRKRYPSEFSGGRFGVITPYKHQLSLLRSRFNAAFGSAVTADMEFNTVDGFQGREVDILILSTVRASSSCSQLNVNLNSIGFVSDVRRMNVALTRAKLSLWIFGNARTLQSDDNWAALLKDTRERNLVLSVRSPYNIDKATARKNLVVQEYGDQPSELGSGKKCADLKELVKEKELIKGASLEKSQEFRSKVAHGHKTSSVAGDASAKVESVSGRKKEKRNVQSVSMNKLSKDEKCSDSGKCVKGSGHKRKECREREFKMGGGHMGKKITAFENTSSCEHSNGNYCGNVLGNVSKGSRKSSESGTSGSPCMHVSTSETDGSDSRKGNYGGDVPRKTCTTSNLIAKRKEQRDAVDAILFSSLIPSKKSEPSRKSGERKRPSSPSLGSSVAKQPKKRKG